MARPGRGENTPALPPFAFHRVDTVDKRISALTLVVLMSALPGCQRPPAPPVPVAVSCLTFPVVVVTGMHPSRIIPARAEIAIDQEELHETAANVLIGAVGVHVIGAILESVRHHENLPLAMITGYKRAALGTDIDNAPAPG